LCATVRVARYVVLRVDGVAALKVQMRERLEHVDLEEVGHGENGAVLRSVLAVLGLAALDAPQHLLGDPELPGYIPETEAPGDSGMAEECSSDKTIRDVGVHLAPCVGPSGALKLPSRSVRA
jgi:hypothetical protein